MAQEADLQEEYEALLTFVYMCPVGVLRATASGDVQMINPQAAQLLLPLTRKRSLKNLFDVLESCAPELREMAERFTPGHGSICEQHRIFISSSGPGPRVLACSLLKINADCLMAVLQDVTHLVEQERQVRQSEAMFAALLAGVNDFALFSLDRQGRIDTWNRSGERLTGFTAEDVQGHDLGILSLPGSQDADAVADEVAEAAREGWSLRDRWFARRDGSRRWCQIMVAAAKEVDGAVADQQPEGADPKDVTYANSPIAGFAVVLRDVTERRVTGEELHRLLTTDYLTGASNRGRFFELAEIEIARCKAEERAISGLMLDVDHFKQVNDCFGHAAGDVVLQRLVTVCRAQLRGGDVIARMGGEEFAILLPDTPLPKALLIAERVRSAIASDIALPGDPCLGGEASPMQAVTVSIGCAALTGAMAGVDALLKAADEALYSAKRSGRDQVRTAMRDAATTEAI